LEWRKIQLSRPNPPFRIAMAAEVDPTLPQPGLSPVCGKPVKARFDGGRLSSDGGVLLLAEIEHRLGIADRLARCLEDPRSPDRMVHGLAEMIRFRALAIAAGYPDANDCDALRRDPAFKMAVGRLPESGVDLCSQPTMTRLENLPGRVALKRMMAAMITLFCDSFAQPPRRLVLDIDDTEDRTYGGQQLSLFNAHHDSPCFMPIHIYEATTGKPVAVVLRPGKTAAGPRSRWCCAMSCAPCAPAGRRSRSSSAATATMAGPRPWTGASATGSVTSSASRATRCWPGWSRATSPAL
jgi:hypothetical protein